MKISFGGKKFRFKESFGEFTLTTIKEYMNIHKDTEELIEDHNEILKKVQDIIPSEKTAEEDERNLIDLDQKMTEIQFKLTGKRIDLLCILCKDASFRDFVMNTNGIEILILWCPYITTELAREVANLGRWL